MAPEKPSFDALAAAARNAGITLLFSGNPDLLERVPRALLVSRDVPAPTPTAGWIRTLIAEAERALAGGETLVTGSGRIAYDLPFWVAAQRKAPIVVVHRECEAPALPLPAGSLQITLAGEASETDRDIFIGSVATAATRIAVRPGGTMAKVAETIAKRGGEIRDISAIKTELSSNVGWPRKTLARVKDFESEKFLTHYTREPDGAWPAESHADYLAWLSNAASIPRDAFAALCRILSERRIRSNGRLVRGGTPVTCWTELAPHAVAELRGWRRGLRRWNFTPYGIAISRDVLETLGARPAKYGEADEPVSGDLAFFQSARSGAYNWTNEREWRIVGDVDLARVAVENLLVLTADAGEASYIQKTFNLRALATG